MAGGPFQGEQNDLSHRRPRVSRVWAREVHPVQKMAERNASEKALHEDPPLEMFYACRGCGRDNTDAWQDIQPKPEMKPITPETAARKFDEVNPVPDPLTLGVGATVKS